MHSEPIHQIFRAALDEWLKKRGRGAQADIARKSRGALSTSQLNDLLKGRRYGTEEQRRLICKIIGVDYEQFLAHGREILGIAPEQPQTQKPVAPFNHNLANLIQVLLNILLVREHALPFKDKLDNLPPHSYERAMYMAGAIGEEIGWPEFPDWARSLPKGKKPPGWEDYVAGKIDDYELYERIKKYALLMKDFL